MKIFSITILLTLFLSVSAHTYQVVPNQLERNHAYYVQQADNRLRDYQSTMPRRVIIVPSSPFSASQAGLRSGVNTRRHLGLR